MTRQEQRHIDYLAWDLLADAKISRLPVEIERIASQYGLDYILDHSKTRYENTLIMSEEILKLYGFKTDKEYLENLSARILSPLIVLKELDVSSPDEISFLTELPLQISIRRYNRYLTASKMVTFGVPHLEQKMIKNFRWWIFEYKKITNKQ